MIDKAEIIRRAIEIRAFDTALLKEYSKGYIRGTVHTSIGQEINSLIISQFITKDDFVFGNHRSHAIYLAVSKDFHGLAAEILGKESGCSAGLGGSQHLKFEKLFTNGIQGGMSAISVGASYRPKADYGLETKVTNISVCLLGDGTFGEGIIYEAFNVSAVFDCPTIFIVEDNEIAQSTPTHSVISSSFSDRFDGFGIENASCNSSDFDSLVLAMESAIEYVKRNSKPFGLIIKSSRLSSHSKGDDNRPQKLINNLLEKDLITQEINSNSELRNFFDEKINYFLGLLEKIKNSQDAKAPYKNYAKELVDKNLVFSSQNLNNPNFGSIRDLTHSQITYAMSRIDSLSMFGEDIEYSAFQDGKPYLGAFGVSKNLSSKFSGRVKSFPISEAALVGFCIGRALNGLPTVCEIMFSDFLTLTVDQLRQQASKLSAMYGEKVGLPVLVRAPSGGRRGYGPTHSQSFESYFLGTPNLIVYAASIFSRESDYYDLLKCEVPVLAIENKDLYLRGTEQKLPLTYSVDNNFDNRSKLVFSPRNYTKTLILTYGHAISLTLSALEILAHEQEIFADVICLQIINPLNLYQFESKLRSTRKIVVIEECVASEGITSSIISELTKLKLSVPVFNLGASGDIGASMYSENDALISEAKIVKMLIELHEFQENYEH